MHSSIDFMPMLAQGATTPLWFYKIPALIFLFCFGACVGSFLNVVAYRLPAGISIVSPPSRCPTCGAMLSWRENFPIVGWILLRGRCRHCGCRISAQYMLIELFVAILFLALGILFYVVPSSTEWWGEIAGPWWFYNGFLKTWPAFLAVLALFGALVAMTLIDARTFTIPLAITTSCIVFSFFMMLLQGFMSDTPKTSTAVIGALGPLPFMDWQWTCVTIGGMLGVAIGLVLLRMGVVRYSFHDYNDWIDAHEPKPTDSKESSERADEDCEDDAMVTLGLMYCLPPLAGAIAGGFGGLTVGLTAFAIAGVVVALLMCFGAARHQSDCTPSGEGTLAPDYPHARREMLRELLFLLPAMVLMTAGYFLGGASNATVPGWLEPLVGSCFGYLYACALSWGVRIIFSVVFNKEALGLGDVHLLGAVGAAIGWIDPLFVFFGGCLIAIQWIIVTIPSKVVLKSFRRELPLGPHLAAGTLFVLLLHPILFHGPNWWGMLVRAWSQISPYFP